MIQEPQLTSIYGARCSKIPGKRAGSPPPLPPPLATYTPKHVKASVLTSAASGLSGYARLLPGWESLWTAAGGSQGEAFTAAEIAMAESGG